MQLYAALLARVHPSQTVRDEFRTKAVNSAINYYAAAEASGSPFLQAPLPSPWRSRDDDRSYVL